MSTKEADGSGDGPVAEQKLETEEKHNELGSGKDSDDEGDEEEEKLEFDVFSRVPPLLIIPSRLEGRKRRRPRAWLPEHLMSTPWLTLFYDLIMVAVLNVFSSRHELVDSSAVGIFFSYFVIIWWLWMSQTAYDIRFQGGDAYHRFCKLLQICVFIYIGAASGGWSPTNLEEDADPLAEQEAAVKQASAQASFRMVSIAYSLSRGVLGCQYIFLILVARHTRRPISSLILPMCGVVCSLVFAILAAALDPSSSALSIAKPTLLYVGIFGEAIAEAVTPALATYVRPSSESLSERLGALTLIIMGEGFIGLVKSFDQAVNGFTRVDSMTYLKCFSAVIIIFLIWIFYFGGFDTRHYVGKRRALIWTVLHMPFHYVLLLFLASMISAIRYRAFSNASIWAVNSFLRVAENATSWSQGLNQLSKPALVEANELALQLGKLKLHPAWPSELALITYASKPNATLSQDIIRLQYVAQIVVQSASTYGVDIDDKILNPFNALLDLSTIKSASAENQNLTSGAAGELFTEVLGEVTTASLSGVLWLFPAAGGTMLVLGILNAIRYQFRGGAPVHFYDISQIVCGALLCLCGLTSIGDKEVQYSDTVYDANLGDMSVTPIYSIVRIGAVLPIIAGLYAAFWGVTTFALVEQKRKRHKYLVREVVEQDFVDDREPRGGTTVLGRAVSRLPA